MSCEVLDASNPRSARVARFARYWPLRGRFAADAAASRPHDPQPYMYVYTMAMCHLIAALKYERGPNLEKGTP